jgi:DNA-directed RNA polymerase delta subunit
MVKNRDLLAKNMATSGTFAELAYAILKKKGKSIHYKDITKEILILKSVTGKTPAQSLRAIIAKDKRFKRVGKGTYGLAEWVK